MGHYQNDYEHAAADLVDYYGQPISYIDPSLGSAISIENAAVSSERSERRKNDHGWYLALTRKVIVLNEDVTVRIDGKVTVTSNGKVYSIEAVRDAGGDRMVLDLIRSEVAEVTRPRYRG